MDGSQVALDMAVAAIETEIGWVNVPAQSVGQACGQNPIAILIPCHRIVGTNWLGGYSSELGTNAKEYLLDLERGQGRLF